MFTFQHPVALLATILLGGFFVLGQAHAENGAVVETITDLNLNVSSDNQDSEASPDNELSDVSSDKQDSEASSDNELSDVSPDKQDSEASSDNELSDVSPGKQDSEASSDNEVSDESPGNELSDESLGNEVRNVSPDSRFSNVSQVNPVSNVSPDNRVCNHPNCCGAVTFPGLQKIGNAVCLVVRQIGSILPRPCRGCGPICGCQANHQIIGGGNALAYRTQLPYPMSPYGFRPGNGSGNFHTEMAPNFTSETGNGFSLQPAEDLKVPAPGAAKIGNRLYQRTLYIQNRNAAIRFLNESNVGVDIRTVAPLRRTNFSNELINEPVTHPQPVPRPTIEPMSSKMQRYYGYR